MNTVIRKVRPDLAAKCAQKLGKPLEEIWPEDDLQLMHYDMFPHGVFHVENAGGMIDDVLDQRVWIGCFPWKPTAASPPFAVSSPSLESRESVLVILHKSKFHPLPYLKNPTFIMYN